MLDESLSKHIYYLVSSKSKIVSCSNTSKLESEYCLQDDESESYFNELRIYSSKDRNTTTLLMYYHVDNFSTGPIIITNNTSLHISNPEFKSIPTGALLFDTDGIKYIETLTSIEVLK